MGRKKYTTELLVERGYFPKDWKEVIIALGKEGKNKMYFANALNLHRDTFYKLLDRDPEFKKTVDIALQYSEQWWIENVREGFEEGTSQRINANLWKHYMANVHRQDWKIEQNIDITTKGDKLNEDNKIEIEIIRKNNEDEEN